METQLNLNPIISDSYYIVMVFFKRFSIAFRFFCIPAFTHVQYVTNGVFFFSFIYFKSIESERKNFGQRARGRCYDLGQLFFLVKNYYLFQKRNVMSFGAAE
jgi:hypothetical protein